MRCLIAAALAGVLTLVSAQAVWAGGYEIGTDQGGEAVARAGASTAYSNPMALYTNVAGIADIPRYMIFLTDSMTFRHVTFTRTAEPAVMSPFGSELAPAHEYAAVDDTTGSFPLGLGLAAHIRLTDYLVLSLGAHGPTAVGWGNFQAPDYEANEAQNDDRSWVNQLTGGSRHDLTHMDVVLLWPTLALGLTVPGVENLRIGLGFQPGFVHMVFTSYAQGPVDSEVETTLSLWDPFIPAGELGVLYRAWRFDLGFNLRMSGSILASGENEAGCEADDSCAVTARLYQPGSNEPEQATAASATFASPWPLAVLRLGVRYAHPRADVAEDARMPWQRDLFDVELDFIYENTSIVDEFTVGLTGVEVGGLPPTDKTLHVTHNWRDNFSLRLGGSVHLLRGMLTLSAGVSWENGAVPEGFTRLDYLSWMRVGLAVGATLRISVIELSLAYQHIFMPGGRTVDPLPEDTSDEDICAQRACMLSAVTENGSAPIAVNTGTYEGGYDVLGISLAFRWGEGSGFERRRPAATEPAADEPPPAATEPTETEPPAQAAPEAAAADSMSELDAEEGAVGGQNAPPSDPQVDSPEEDLAE